MRPVWVKVIKVNRLISEESIGSQFWVKVGQSGLIVPESDCSDGLYRMRIHLWARDYQLEEMTLTDPGHSPGCAASCCDEWKDMNRTAKELANGHDGLLKELKVNMTKG